MKQTLTRFLLLLILCAAPFLTQCSAPPPAAPSPSTPTDTPPLSVQEVSICELTPALAGTRVKITGEIKSGSLDTTDLSVVALTAVDPVDDSCEVLVRITRRVIDRWTNAKKASLQAGKLLRFTGVAFDEAGGIVIQLQDEHATISPAPKP